MIQAKNCFCPLQHLWSESEDHDSLIGSQKGHVHISLKIYQYFWCPEGPLCLFFILNRINSKFFLKYGWFFEKCSYLIFFGFLLWDIFKNSCIQGGLWLYALSFSYFVLQVKYLEGTLPGGQKRIYKRKLLKSCRERSNNVKCTPEPGTVSEWAVNVEGVTRPFSSSWQRMKWKWKQNQLLRCL